MKIDLVTRLVIHELRPLGSGQNSDRRGPICDLMLADIPNTERAISVAVRILQRVCSLLDDGYFWSDNRDKGPSEFTEQFEAWIDPMPVFLEGKAVRILHKYWSKERVDGFLDIMARLAQLHGWEIEDHRSWEHEPGDHEEEMFLEAVEKLHPEVEGDQEEIQQLAEEYTESAHHMDTCPWRLLALNAAGICWCSAPETPEEAQVNPKSTLVEDEVGRGQRGPHDLRAGPPEHGRHLPRTHPTGAVEGEGAKVIPFQRKP